jgi:hypothetical protein
MTICLSLGGVPPTSGFFGKFASSLGDGVCDGQLLWLVLVGVVVGDQHLLPAHRHRDVLPRRRPVRADALPGLFMIAICPLIILEMASCPAGGCSSWASVSELASWLERLGSTPTIQLEGEPTSATTGGCGGAVRLP